uniref:Uncharacterized protein n=1 Tax=Magallana gigas TaxID=29159 RepID=K1RND2_MAGGI
MRAGMIVITSNVFLGDRPADRAPNIPAPPVPDEYADITFLKQGILNMGKHIAENRKKYRQKKREEKRRKKQKLKKEKEITYHYCCNASSCPYKIFPVTIIDIFKFIRLVIDSNKIKGNRKQTPDNVYVRSPGFSFCFADHYIKYKLRDHQDHRS